MRRGRAQARSGAPGERPKRRTPGAQAEGRGVGTGGDGGGGSGGGFRAFAWPCPFGAWVRRGAAEPGRAQAGRLGGAVYGEAPDSGPCGAGHRQSALAGGGVRRGRAAGPIGGSGGAPEAPNARSASGGPGGRDRGRRQRGGGRALSGFRAALPRLGVRAEGRGRAWEGAGGALGGSGLWGKPRTRARAGRGIARAPLRGRVRARSGRRPGIGGLGGAPEAPNARSASGGPGVGGRGRRRRGVGRGAFGVSRGPALLGAWVRRGAAEPREGARRGACAGAVYGDAPEPGLCGG